MTQTFPNNHQPPHTNLCGPVCLQNIYEYFGIVTTVDQTLTELHRTQQDETYLAEAGTHLLHHGLKTKMYSSNPSTVSLEWRDLSKETVLKKLQAWLPLNQQNDWRANALFLLLYLENGGDLRITNLTTQLLDAQLNEHRILLVCVQDSWMWGKRLVRKSSGDVEFDDIHGNGAGHFVVIYGHENEKYLVSDPFPTGLESKNGLYEIPKDQLLVAILTWGREVLAVWKEEK